MGRGLLPEEDPAQQDRHDHTELIKNGDLRCGRQAVGQGNRDLPAGAQDRDHDQHDKVMDRREQKSPRQERDGGRRAEHGKVHDDGHGRDPVAEVGQQRIGGAVGDSRQKGVQHGDRG